MRASLNVCGEACHKRFRGLLHCPLPVLSSCRWCITTQTTLRASFNVCGETCFCMACPPHACSLLLYMLHHDTNNIVVKLQCLCEVCCECLKGSASLSSACPLPEYMLHHSVNSTPLVHATSQRGQHFHSACCITAWTTSPLYMLHDSVNNTDCNFILLVILTEHVCCPAISSAVVVSIQKDQQREQPKLPYQYHYHYLALHRCFDLTGPTKKATTITLSVSLTLSCGPLVLRRQWWSIVQY